ncbi:MAG: peptidoglycan DD-metalloendopeptidase family protein [Blautia sp.]|nr:peptidoglycan DD-metalloendopeptidase family protein [Blautia sp.]
MNRKKLYTMILTMLCLCFLAFSLKPNPVHAASKYRNEFVEKNGKTYYVNDKGKVVKGIFTVDGYQYGSDPTTGVIAKNTWYKLNNKVYRAGSDGRFVKGIFVLDGKKYYLNPKNYEMYTGWLKSKNKYYYLSPKTGACVTGKVKSKGKLYVFTKSGINYRNTWIQSGNDKYYATNKGYLASGLVTLPDGNSYYFSKETFKMQTGWQKEGDKEYFFHLKTGILVKDYWIDNSHYVDQNGVYDTVYSKTKNIWPLQTKHNQISSYFGYRESPGGIGSTNHKGLDIAAPTGAPIYAIRSGVVYSIQTPDQSGGGGNYTVIYHGNNAYSGYMHQSKFAKNLKVGAKVRKGQVIGYVGSTGNSTGPHLHLEIKINGVHLNPLLYVTPPK